MLKANEGKIIKTVIIISFINSLLGSELSPLLDKANKIPKIPKTIEAQMKTFVAIFCMVLV